jgi:hypothetical protein
VAIRRALKRAIVAGHRLEAQRARYDMRDWVVRRRKRTRHLIELGDLVVKAGLVELANDDRAVLFGASIELADMLRSEEHARTILLWRRQRKPQKVVCGNGRAKREASVCNTGYPAQPS